jgi:PadR family transcriptional regulator, regulatory protein PadR
LRYQSLNRMKGYIGEFEELVLLTIAVLGDDAYGVSIKEDIEARSSRSISIGALHSTIARLEEKGFLKSFLGGATQERGGRRKRFYQLTHAGKSALHDIKNLRDELWKKSKANLALEL